MSEKKILVVDDEAQIREMLEMALNRAGYTVRLATGAEEALKIIARAERTRPQPARAGSGARGAWPRERASAPPAWPREFSLSNSDRQN